MELLIMILRTKQLEFSMLDQFLKDKYLYKCNERFIYKLKENRGEHSLINNEGDISLFWHVTKKNITQGVYLQITKELHGTINNDST